MLSIRCLEFDNLKELKYKVDKGIESLTFNETKNLIKLNINGIEYQINLYSELKNTKACKMYLKNANFYKYLTEKQQMK